MKETIADFFKWYNLYDTPVSGLKFDFENQTLSLGLQDYDDVNKTNVDVLLNFKQVTKFTFDYPTDRFIFQVVAIYRAKLNVINDVSYELSLLIDMPEKEIKFGRHEVITAGEMLIGFEDLEVIGGLSREAMAYKWQNED